MAYISKLTMGGVEYDIYDAEIRELISKVLVFAGVTSVSLADGGTTPSTYGGLTGIATPYPIDPTTGQPHNAADTVDTGTVVLSDSKEFVWDGTKWVEFGDLSDLSLNPTYGNFLTSVSATPTLASDNTGAGTAHSHTMSGTTQYLELGTTHTRISHTTQTATIAGAVANGELATLSGSMTGDAVLTSLSVGNLVTQSQSLAVAGTTVPVFNSIDATSTNGIKIITEVSGGGQAGEVTTAGVAASLATTVATAASTAKLVTSAVTPAAVGTAVNVVTGLGSSAFYASVSSNSDGTNTYTLMLDAITVNSTNITPATAGTQITFATGALSTTGSGSTVAYGVATASQTTNIPTAVSFGTVVINGTPSYIHTSNIVPASASTVTFATGAVAINGSGATVAYSGTKKYLALTSQSIKLAGTVVASSSLGTSFMITSAYLNAYSETSDGRISYIQSLDSTTGVESSHTHTYSIASAISLTTSSASALTSVTLTTAS